MLYKFAGLVVEMKVENEPLLSQSKAYEINEASHIDIKIPYMPELIEKYENINKHLSYGECEYMLYGAYFYKELLNYNGILLHSSCVVKDGYAYLFSAPSGTGKSTHTQLWLKVFKDAKILNDDKPAIIVRDGIAYACGTPFSGKTNQNINEIYPIKGIAFLERGKENTISKIDSMTAIYNIMNQTLRPDDEKSLDKFVSVLNVIVGKINFFKFACNMNEDAPIISYEGMNK